MFLYCTYTVLLIFYAVLILYFILFYAVLILYLYCTSQETAIPELDLVSSDYERFSTAGKMTIYKLKEVKVITVEPTTAIGALLDILTEIEVVPKRMQHIVLIYECNLSLCNIYKEVANKLQDFKVVT